MLVAGWLVGVVGLIFLVIASCIRVYAFGFCCGFMFCGDGLICWP